MLRKSVEQKAFDIHFKDKESFTLEMCAEVNNRCQHKPGTALSQYVTYNEEQAWWRMRCTIAKRTSAIAKTTSQVQCIHKCNITLPPSMRDQAGARQSIATLAAWRLPLTP